MRHQVTHYRDKTFDFYRRFYGDLFSTDIDAVEFYNFEPIDIREYKSRKSKWRNGRNAAVTVQAKLARSAGIPYYVVEYDVDWSAMEVCQVEPSGNTYSVIDAKELDLQRYLAWLYKMRGLKLPNGLPKSFEPITKQKAILNLWDELTQSEKSDLLQELMER